MSSLQPFPADPRLEMGSADWNFVFVAAARRCQALPTGAIALAVIAGGKESSSAPVGHLSTEVVLDSVVVVVSPVTEQPLTIDRQSVVHVCVVVTDPSIVVAVGPQVTLQSLAV